MANNKVKGCYFKVIVKENKNSRTLNYNFKDESQNKIVYYIESNEGIFELFDRKTLKMTHSFNNKNNKFLTKLCPFIFEAQCSLLSKREYHINGKVRKIHLFIYKDVKSEEMYLVYHSDGLGFFFYHNLLTGTEYYSEKVKVKEIVKCIKNDNSFYSEQMSVKNKKVRVLSLPPLR
ncbi:hypothetical protein [Arsenicibacter rosenii]|uniref:Uncharacterized protein n=1 Tax=Arsenicibacter rosenii TaxID=1750698 RepID=A0A1S2VA47_9BACT|nr:hypothetical protein [Arsenicibacter rosenii]OIN55614.1 hypothetical protein BLX24_29170 [Arsenicibacter rosenii]